MHAVVRTYSGPGAKELFDVIEQNKGDVERLIRGINGFVAYTIARTPEGGVSVTVCQDKAGTDESVRLAADWIRQNASQVSASAPAVSEGSVILNLK